jgi:hypothetical protein
MKDLYKLELTYDEWKDIGYHVNKDEKSFTRNKKREATFTYMQVDKDEDDSDKYSFDPYDFCD